MIFQCDVDLFAVRVFMLVAYIFRGKESNSEFDFHLLLCFSFVTFLILRLHDLSPKGFIYTI